jgi:hypothetical protein
LYFGDSNIEQYWPRIERLLSDGHTSRSVIFATTGGCPAIPRMREVIHPNCVGFAEKVIALAGDPSIKTVVIGGAWHTYFNNSPYYLEGDSGGHMMVGTEPWNRAFDELAQMIGDLVSQGKLVWVVLNIPMGQELSPTLSVRRSLTGATTFRAVQLDRPAFERTWGPIRAKMIDAARIGGAHTIDPMEWLCQGTTCPGQTPDGMLTYMDAGHLRSSYVRDHVTFIDQTLYGSQPIAASGAAIETQWNH